MIIDPLWNKLDRALDLAARAVKAYEKDVQTRADDHTSKRTSGWYRR